MWWRNEGKRIRRWEVRFPTQMRKENKKGSEVKVKKMI